MSDEKHVHRDKFIIMMPNLTEKFAIEIDPEQVQGISLDRGIIRVGNEAEFTGETTLTLRFQGLENAPVWIKIGE